MFSEINTYITQIFYIRNTSNDYVVVGWRQQSNTTVWNFDYVVLLEATRVADHPNWMLSLPTTQSSQEEYSSRHVYKTGFFLNKTIVIV